jgi:hypothetical protein
MLDQAMRTRPMAALLVLTLVSWVGSFAQASEGVHPAPIQQKPIRHQHGHHCCWPQQVVMVQPALPPQPAGRPCGNEHPCCVRPAPENTPSLPSTFGPQRPAGKALATLFFAPNIGPSRRLPEPERRHTLGNHSQFSTILRI